MVDEDVEESVQEEYSVGSDAGGVKEHGLRWVGGEGEEL